MDTPIAVAVISAAVAVVLPAISFYLTKKKELEADWRKYKFEQYQELVNAMSWTVGTDSTPEGQRRWTTACNSVQLIASTAVIRALHEFQDEIRISNPNKTRERHDALLSQLIGEIRIDLEIPGTPAAQEFTASLWCSGAPPESR